MIDARPRSADNLRVSVLIPVHNAERWVGHAIESALAQTHQNLEVIVVDDGSNDGSLDVIRSFGACIRFESGPNSGANYARNRLLAMAEGDWLQYLDADDYLLPAKIGQQVEVVTRDPSIDVLYGPAYTEWTENGRVMRKLDQMPDISDPWRLLALWRLPQTGAMFWKRHALEEVGGWNEAQTVSQDFELYFRLLRAGKRFAYDEASGAVYRIWSDDTLSRRNRRATLASRLGIVEEAEAFLRSTGNLTRDRAIAMCQGRFDCARGIWSMDRAWARKIFEDIEVNHPGFEPKGSAAPLSYRLVSWFLGLSGAARFAELKRQIGFTKRGPGHPGYCKGRHKQP